MYAFMTETAESHPQNKGKSMSKAAQGNRQPGIVQMRPMNNIGLPYNIKPGIGNLSGILLEGEPVGMNAMQEHGAGPLYWSAISTNMPVQRQEVEPIGEDGQRQKEEPIAKDDFVKDFNKPGFLPGKVKATGVFQKNLDENEDSVQQRIYNRYIQLFSKVTESIRMAQRDESIKQTSEAGGEDHLRQLFDIIKDKFTTQKNIDVIIGKSFASSTGASLGLACYNAELMAANYFIGDTFVKRVTDNLVVPITETLNDILFWVKDKREEKVEEIILTDSDVHFRGIGVCIVTFKSNLRIVVKPGDKTFERLIYHRDNSLAVEFNELSSPDSAKIGTLKIEVSKDHGSVSEYFNHLDMEEKNKNLNVDLESLNKIIEFASLLGLADLHHENLVYEETGEPKKPQLIDAEVGLKYQMNKHNPLATSITSGEMMTALPFGYNPNFTHYYNDKDYMDALINFLDINVRNKLKGKKCRRVIIPTGELYGIRTRIYANKPYSTKMYDDRLRNVKTSIGGKWTILENLDLVHKYMILDLRKGIIPFYEHDFSYGVIYQKFSDGSRLPIMQSDDETLDNIIDRNIKILQQLPSQQQESQLQAPQT